MLTDLKQTNNQTKHVVSIFFDFEKAYDTAWEYRVMTNLYPLDIRGHLPLLFKTFFVVDIGVSH